jgi:signal transduction histidine kinase
MSYRSFKRVLGETSLERKCRILFGACLFLLIAASFWWYGNKTALLVDKQNPIKGRLLVDTVLALHHWHAMEKPEYQQAPRDMMARLTAQNYEWAFLRPSSPLEDPEDAAILQQFAASRPDLVEDDQPATNASHKGSAPLDAVSPTQSAEGVEEANPPSRRNEQRRMYYYYQPVYSTRTRCVNCHNLFLHGTGIQLATEGISPSGANPPRLPESLGDLKAVVKIGIPTEATQQDLAVNRAILMATAIITGFMAMLASYVIVRYVIVKPLAHLREVSDAISRGNIDKRAELHTGDEFESLAVAFNRMLRHLVEAHQELRHVNADLDSKVDQLAQMNMRLYEMNRLKGDFLATMSHELRTPLNSIIGFSDVLGSIAALDEKQKRYVQNIQKSGKMLLDMINDILDLAKIESGKMEIRLTHFRVSHIVGALCDMCRPLTEKKNIDLESEIQPALPELYQDQNKVKQILNNLLSNAIKFTPEGGRIVVKASRDGDGRLVLVVADTGIGIAEEDQQQIFEKFRQGKVVLGSGDAMTREYSGTGLGLSIVRELCRLLGGEISLESELGKGSTFTVRLPWTLTDRAPIDVPMPEALAELTKPRRGDFAAAQPASASPGG